MANGESKVIIIPLFVQSTAVDGSSIDITFDLAHASDATAGSSSISSTVNAAPTAQVVVSSAKQLVEAGDEVTFEVSFGNIGASAINPGTLTALLPSGTTFLNASDGGTLSGSTITWDLGVVNSGTSGKRLFTAMVSGSANDGMMLSTDVAFSSGGSTLATGGEILAVDSGIDLDLDVTVTGDSMHGDQFSYFRYVVSNTGSSSLTGVALRVMVPQHSAFGATDSVPVPTGCSSSVCDAGEWAVYEIGQLDAGETKVFVYPLYDSSPIDGEPMVTHAVLVDGSNDYILGTKPTVLYETTTSLVLSTAASKQVVAAEEVYEYELSYGNRGGSAVQDLVLAMTLPANTTFVSATDGGAESGGVVSWDLATLNTGVAGKRFVTVQANTGLGDGEVLVSKAELNTAGPSLVRAGESVVIREGVDLNLDVTVTGDSMHGDQFSYFRYVVSNTGNSSLADVVLRVVAPNRAAFRASASLPVPTGCSASICNGSEAEWGVYTIGQLDAGETRVISYSLFDESPIDGEPMVTHALLTEGSGDYTLGVKPTVLYETTTGLDLNTSASKQVVAAEEVFDYELSYGNRGGSAVQDLVLAMTLPANTSFVSASDGGTESGGVVTWP
ncbi:hypothetical protein, partial [Halioxenophilus sp. WMMB6]|uniref:hypothetical protein n=1 Tax=Halioxenophilus sp. WMMB6 TaxID=3073815 RepID=UPI00295F4331